MNPIFWTYDELKHSQKIVYRLHNIFASEGFQTSERQFLFPITSQVFLLLWGAHKHTLIHPGHNTLKIHAGSSRQPMVMDEHFFPIPSLEICHFVIS